MSDFTSVSALVGALIGGAAAWLLMMNGRAYRLKEGRND